MFFEPPLPHADIPLRSLLLWGVSGASSIQKSCQFTKLKIFCNTYVFGHFLTEDFGGDFGGDLFGIMFDDYFGRFCGRYFLSIVNAVLTQQALGLEYL